MVQIAIDLHNMSNSKTELVRTGIQEVSYQIFRTIIQNQGKFSDRASGRAVRIVPVLSMTHLPNSALPDFFFPTYFANSPAVLDLALESLGCSRQGFLDIFPECAGFFSPDPQQIWESIEQIVIRSDAYLSVPLCDVRHVFEHGRRHSYDCIFGQIVHDLGPALRPEFVVNELRSWFVTQGLENLRESDFLISVSQFTAQEMSKFIGRRQHRLAANNRFVALPNESYPSPSDAADIEALSRFGLRSKQYFLSAGTLEPRKNTLLTLRGYARYRQRYVSEHSGPGLQLVVTGGSGWLNEHVLAEFSGSDLKEHLKICGFVTDEDLVTLTRHAAALCFPSHYEGFGIPPARALALGTPVITTPMSSLPEACSESSIYVSPDDVDGMAAAFSAALRLPPPLPRHLEQMRRTWGDYLIDLVHQVVSAVDGCKVKQQPETVTLHSAQSANAFVGRCRSRRPTKIGLDYSPRSLIHSESKEAARLIEVQVAWGRRGIDCLRLAALVTDARLQDSRKDFLDPASAVTQIVLQNSGATTLSALDIDALLLLIEPRSLTVAITQTDLFVCLSPTRLEDMRDVELLQDWAGVLVCVDHPSFDSHPNIRAARRSFARHADLIITHNPKNYEIDARQRIIHDTNPLLAAMNFLEECVGTDETYPKKAHQRPDLCPH
jgi:glycosyltransferase involved in cell wall biosynthesis